MLEREECPKYSLEGWEKVEVCSESLKVTTSVDTEKRLVQAKGVSVQTPISRALGPCGVVAREDTGLGSLDMKGSVQVDSGGRFRRQKLS